MQEEVLIVVVVLGPPPIVPPTDEIIKDVADEDSWDVVERHLRGQVAYPVLPKLTGKLSYLSTSNLNCLCISIGRGVQLYQQGKRKCGRSRGDRARPDVVVRSYT